MSGPGGTGRGEARRAALVDAAAALLLEQGFRAVSHRAVAARAALPLASTTYYFATLDDLLAAAAAQLAAQHVAAARAQVDRLPARPVGATACARRLVALVLPQPAEPAALLGFYERYLEAGRAPGLRPVLASWNAALRDLLGTALTRLGHTADPDLVLAVVDGLVLTALAEGAPEPARAAERGLARLLQR